MIAGSEEMPGKRRGEEQTLDSNFQNTSDGPR
jgi:hypothetical protein